MHVLALLHQTIREHEWSTRLMLNGAAVRLGIALDVIDQEHGRREFELGLVDGEMRYLWRFRGERHEMSMAVTYVNAGGEERRDPDALHRLMPEGRGGEALARRLEGLSYLTAERLGPREVAAAGVQVLAETHSDHVLNGVRRAVKKGILPPDDALLHFFRPREEAGEERSQVESPRLDSEGRVGALPRDRQRAVMWWLTRGGPFWWRDRRHGGDDYLESQGDLVTESAIAEVAFRTLLDLECSLMSFSPSDWNQSPIEVIWRREAEGFDDESVPVENFWTAGDLEARLARAMAPIRSRAQLQQVSQRGFPGLAFGEDCFSPLGALPFRRSAATRILELLRILDRFAAAFHGDGSRSREGHRIQRDHFTGDNAVFSDSSPTEKREFGQKLRFPHPDKPGEALPCT